MSWSYRRSIGFPAFRINFSKKGIGATMGIKGVRVNTSTRGTYVSLNLHGISYRQKISGSVTPPAPVPQTVPVPLVNNIVSAHIEELTDSDSRAFVTELNQKCRQSSYTRRWGILPLIIILLILLLTSYRRQQHIIQPASDSIVVIVHAYDGANVRETPGVKSHILATVPYSETLLLLDSTNHQWYKVSFADTAGYINRELAYVDHISHAQITEETWELMDPYLGYELLTCIFCFIPLIYWLKKVDRKRFEMQLYYDMDDKYQQVYQQFKTHFDTFCQSARIWQYLNMQCTSDQKRNAGAAKLIKRTAIRGVSANKMPVPYFITNVSIPCISLNNVELFFLPERLLIKHGNTFAAVFYKNLHITSNVTRFVESETVPRDAEVVDYTWLYVNKTGGPDQRFNNNRKLPVCAYSEYMFTSDTGIFEVIATSKLSAMDAFTDFLSKIGELQKRFGECGK